MSRRWRAIATVAVGLAMAACGMSGQPVALLTGVDGCYAGGETGHRDVLLADPDYGTSFSGKPVMWPVGFRGVRVGEQIQVLDSGGTVVATTGRAYYLAIGPVMGSSESRQLMDRVGAYPVAANTCGYAWDFIDCTAVDESPSRDPRRMPAGIDPASYCNGETP